MKRLGIVWLSLLLVMLPLWAQGPVVREAPSIDAVKQLYPGATIKIVTMSEFAAMTARSKGNGTLLIADVSKDPEEWRDYNRSDSMRTGANREQQLQKEAHINIDITPHGSGGDGGGGHGAEVLLIVIAFVVVAIFVVYAGKAIYELATSNKEYRYWMDIGWIYTVYNEEGNNPYSHHSGSMSGVKIAAGFHDGGEVQVGVAVEVGSFNFGLDGKAEEESDFLSLGSNEKVNWIEYGGSYAMAGLHVRLSTKPEKGFYYLELLSGKSSHESVNTLSVGRIGGNFFFGQVGLGLNLGALYMGLNDTDGIIQNVDNYEYIVGYEVRYRF